METARVRRGGVDLAEAAGGQYDGAGMYRADPVPLAFVHDVQRDSTGHTGRIAEQVEDDGVLDDVHTRRGQQPRLQGALDLGAGRVSPRVRNAVSTMTALSREGQLPVPGAVEPGADGGQVAHRGWALPNEDAHCGLVTDPVAGGNRVGEVLRWAVADTQGRGDTALGPARRPGGQHVLGHDENAQGRLASDLQGGGQPGNTRADDHHVRFRVPARRRSPQARGQHQRNTSTLSMSRVRPTCTAPNKRAGPWSGTAFRSGARSAR